ncbi:MAG: ThuA domain-containing protein [Anaerolineae bacterium]|nr:ThuA domain-containing protein [Anaerolineae bacterium]
MNNKRMLIVLGGTWHDFDGFAHSMQSLLTPKGWVVEATYDLDRLTRLDEESFDLILNYTCFTKPDEGSDSVGPEKMNDAQIQGLMTWVRGGGAFLAAHSATVLGESSPLLGELIGGVFVEHPPQFTFTVYPLSRPHPITVGIEAFTVRDELYIERCDESVNIQMVAIDRGVAHPMVWSKQEGQGRVAHVALGHSADVWQLGPYQRLMLQTIKWLINGK